VKAYRLLLWVLALAALGALAYGLLAEDPGYLLLEWQGYSVEATLVAALGLLLLIWIAFRFALVLLLWPLRAWRRHGARLARRRLADGLRALKRGENALALKLSAGAARRPRFRVAALMVAVEAAAALGDDAALLRHLQSLEEAEPESARLAKAEGLLRRAELEPAYALLQAASEPLAPRLRELRIEAALGCGEPSAAADDLRALSAQGVRVDSALLRRVQTALLAASHDTESLRQRLSELPKAARSAPHVVTAFCARARALGDSALADDHLERVLVREWSEALAADYGLGAEGPQRERIRRAEDWLGSHPDSAALQLVLGRLCRIDGLWGKAEAHLLRAGSGPLAASAWEELAIALVAQGDDARARLALQNALAVPRGQPAQRLGQRPRSLLDTASEARERRSSMGVPLLADGSAPEAS